MGVLKIFSALKSTDAKAENVSEEPSITPSPAVSSISSYGSGSLLVHGQQPRLVHKKKHVSWTTGRKQLSTRLANIVWSGLFLTVIIATVIVAAALAENIRRTLGTKVSFTDRDSELHSVSNSADDFHHKIDSEGEQKTCVHRRILWEHGSRSSEIIHDMRSRWSAIVDHDEERCLIFDLRNSRHTGCPVEYPWDMDLHVGIPACRGPLAVIAPIRKIMHHICNEQHVNLTFTGEAISTQCSDHRILQVDKVIIQYFDRNFRRVARRSALNKEQLNLHDIIKPPFVSDAEDSAKSSAAPEDDINPEKKRPHNSAMPTKKASKTQIENSDNDKQAVVSSSNVKAQHVLSSRTPLSETHHKQTTAPSSTTRNKPLKNRIPIIITKIVHSNLIRALVGGVKQEPSGSGTLAEDDGSTGNHNYWAVMYNYVDEAGNDIRASSFKEMKLGRK